MGGWGGGGGGAKPGFMHDISSTIYQDKIREKVSTTKIIY